jgi:hypothetical protein
LRVRPTKIDRRNDLPAVDAKHSRLLSNSRAYLEQFGIADFVKRHPIFSSARVQVRLAIIRSADLFSLAFRLLLDEFSRASIPACRWSRPSLMQSLVLGLMPRAELATVSSPIDWARAVESSREKGEVCRSHRALTYAASALMADTASLERASSVFFSSASVSSSSLTASL